MRPGRLCIAVTAVFRAALGRLDHVFVGQTAQFRS
jgi:hypothetical protein